MASFRERKIAKKKEDILRAAAAVLAEKGYHGTTMEEVAARLLMTKGSMYYYFKNKDELLYQCHQMIMEISNSRIEEVVKSPLNPNEKLENAIKAHVSLATSEKAMFMVMDNPHQNFTEEYLPEILESRRVYSNYFDQIINDGIEKGVFKKVDVKMVRMIILGALNWIQQWYKTDGQKSAADISDVFAEYLLKMVVKK